MYGLRTDRGRGFRDRRMACLVKRLGTRYGNEGSSRENVLTDEASMKGGKDRHVDSMQSKSGHSEGHGQTKLC